MKRNPPVHTWGREWQPPLHQCMEIRNNETLNKRGILKQLSSDQMRSRYSLHMKFGSANPASMAKQSFPRYKYGDRKLEMPDQIVRTD